MKGKFDPYVLWPLAKSLQNWIVDRSTARDFTVYIEIIFFAWCINLGKIVLKKLMKFMNSELPVWPKWYKYTWTGISIESIWAWARTILLTFAMSIACSSWITLNYNQIDITKNCPLYLAGSKLISIWYELQKNCILQFFNQWNCSLAIAIFIK